MKSAQGRFHWDKRHKRYVQLQPDEKLRGTGKRKTESGGVVRLQSPTLYLLQPFQPVKLPIGEACAADKRPPNPMLLSPT